MNGIICNKFVSFNVVSDNVVSAYCLYSDKDAVPIPSWADITFNFTQLTRSDLDKMNIPSTYTTGFSFGTFVLDQKYYLRYEMNKLKSRGVTLIQRHIRNVSELFDQGYDIIVNCSGETCFFSQNTH